MGICYSFAFIDCPSLLRFKMVLIRSDGATLPLLISEKNESLLAVDRSMIYLFGHLQSTYYDFFVDRSMIPEFQLLLYEIERECASTQDTQATSHMIVLRAHSSIWNSPSALMH